MNGCNCNCDKLSTFEKVMRGFKGDDSLIKIEDLYPEELDAYEKQYLENANFKQLHSELHPEIIELLQIRTTSVDHPNNAVPAR